MEKKPDQEGVRCAESGWQAPQSRRQALRRAAWVAPAIVSAVILSPRTAAASEGGCHDPPPLCPNP